jgi:proteasome accessory factor A
LKLGTTGIVLDMIEAGVEFPNLELEDPVRAIKEVSRDLDMHGTLKLADGRVTSAIGMQQLFLKTAQDFFACHELTQITKDILVRWEETLSKLEQDPMLLVRELDWVAKRQMIRSYMDRKGCGWEDPRVLLLDLQYHDVRPDKGLYYTLERSNLIDRLLQDHEIARALDTPPTDTRAYFRGQCLKKFPRDIYAASWTSVLFDVGNTTIKKIPLMEPLRGTESLTRELLEGSASAESLLAKLTA